MMAFLGRLALRLLGWRIEGSLPAEDRYVAIGAPHSATLDTFVLLASITALKLPVRFLVKAEGMRGLLGVVLRAFGGLSVDRSSQHDLVRQLSDLLRQPAPLVLLLSPEGTRSRVPYWRSGFYHIARAADVPVLPVALDAKQRRVVLGPALRLTGDIGADMDRIRAFYAEHASSVFPERVGPMRLREEG